MLYLCVWRDSKMYRKKWDAVKFQAWKQLFVLIVNWGIAAQTEIVTPKYKGKMFVLLINK